MEKLILVDLDDNEIGSGEKLKVHEEAKLHRAFSIFIVHEGKMLIQKRAKKKYHSGDLWANAVCSHPRKGENLFEATHRRLQEEAGFDTELKELFHFVYKTDFKNKLSEYEFDHVFIGDFDGKPKYDPNEASDYKWIELDKLKNDLRLHPEKYASWFLIACPRVFEILETSSDLLF